MPTPLVASVHKDRTLQHDASFPASGSTPTPEPYSRALHGLAVVTVIAIFPLIFMGGLVTSHGAGLAVPDWPNSFGYNMFALPFNRWVGGVFYEHTHRLLGSVAGFCAILLVFQSWGTARNPRRRHQLGRFAMTLGALGVIGAAVSMIFARQASSASSHHMMQSAIGLIALALILVAAWAGRRREPRATVRWLSIAILGLVIVQGILGGLRVVLVNLDLAIVHACVAQAFLCLCGAFAVMTSRWWIEQPARRTKTDDAASSGPASLRSIARLATLAVIVIYAQLVVGALMRHYQAGLAIPDFPLNYGKWLPPTTPQALKQVNAIRMADGNLNTVGLWQIWLHYGHRIGALLVTAVLLWLIIRVFRRAQRQPALTRPAWILLVLLALQLTLGILTVLWRKPADIASSHVATGALILLTTFVLALRAARAGYVASRSLIDPGVAPDEMLAGASATDPSSASRNNLSINPA